MLCCLPAVLSYGRERELWCLFLIVKKKSWSIKSEMLIMGYRARWVLGAAGVHFVACMVIQLLCYTSETGQNNIECKLWLGNTRKHVFNGKECLIYFYKPRTSYSMLYIFSTYKMYFYYSNKNIHFNKLILELPFGWDGGRKSQNVNHLSH